MALTDTKVCAAKPEANDYSLVDAMSFFVITTVRMYSHQYITHGTAMSFI
ncbi:hypothetical protein HB991_07150 [Yersinia mollaretii]|uniref:Uncharacterized protein n=1 Tax=Yersinia mollaretii TaxID=33060 RepID=A0AA44HZG5_YERMO|nr:hypothetical protein [Yersinia mollaretii]NIL22290.1 hypothetical protein [Yersinia mollaretii]CNI51473.1 Uncharacterised protein [Yersinia mollaretii]CQQ51153.1 Uncharacterised protein [Yersinia mollaretii]